LSMLTVPRGPVSTDSGPFGFKMVTCNRRRDVQVCAGCYRRGTVQVQGSQCMEPAKCGRLSQAMHSNPAALRSRSPKTVNLGG
jgi:hypothetical protein